MKNPEVDCLKVYQWSREIYVAVFIILQQFVKRKIVIITEGLRKSPLQSILNRCFHEAKSLATVV
jgi:hypothetical protein